jgi:hypothetical protein
MGRTALGVVAGGTTAFLWFFLLYGVWFFIPVESPPPSVDFITKWFPLTVALPALLLAGVAAALVAREFWAMASVLSGAVVVGFVGWFTQASGAIWVLLALTVVGIGLASLGAYVTRLVGKHA